MRLANLSAATLWDRSYAFMTVAFVGLSLCAACSFGNETSGHKNSLRQQTGQEGSTVPRANPPYYPNTSGNIVAPPGNPGGNPAGAPPLVGGNMNQESGWPNGR